MKRLIASALVMASMTGTAFAADLMYAAADPVVAEQAMFDWTGFYVGVQGGLAAGTVRLDDGFCVQFDDCGAPGSRYFSEPDLNGWELGAHIGAAKQLGSIVLGVETDLNWSNVEGDAGFMYYNADTGENEDGNPTESTSFALKWEGSAVAKIGFAVDRFMPYVTAGIAYGQADLSAHREFGPEGDTRELDFEHPTTNLLGYTVGIGGAYAMTDNIVLNAEVRYTQYGEVYNHADLINDGETLVVNGPDLLKVQTGISFKF
jgi:outer membrane immunogenic protein